MAKQLAPSSPLKANGKTQSITAWAVELGCPVQTILGRLKRKWTPDRAVSEPIGDGGSNRGKKLAPEVLTPEELSRVLAACNDGATGIRNRALIVMGWRAGLRISEAIALRLKDLDEKQQTIRVLHGKGDKARTVGLDQQAWSVLSQWLATRSTLAIDQDATVFCTLGGGVLLDRYVRALMPRLAKEAGIAKRTHFHALRHTMAFELASEGVPMHLIQQQLGHSNLAITSRYISHLNPSETIAAMKARAWGQSKTESGIVTSVKPAPDWLTRLRSDIGERLMLIHDARSSEDQFKAVVLLF
ncbi:MAG: site-specific integrase [Schlesneria sp.]